MCSMSVEQKKNVASKTEHINKLLTITYLLFIPQDKSCMG